MPAPYQVIHHQGVLEHFTVPQIHSALAQQVALANWVVFSVPSVYYTESDMGDERLMPIEEWQRILAPFQIESLRYYGHPQSDNRDHILCVLRGDSSILNGPVAQTTAQRITPSPVQGACSFSPVLKGRVDPSRPEDARPEAPLPGFLQARNGDSSIRNPQFAIRNFPEGISAIVHTRNEEKNLRDCLASLGGWIDEIIVCDMESTDATCAIAAEFTEHIVQHPLISNFDRARNVSAMRASYSWVFYLDADERVPPVLGQSLRRIALTQGETFEAMLIPFRHHFAGHWLQCLSPGYTAPRLLKNGKFLFNARLHSGTQVDGRITRFPADNPDLAITHYSFDSLSHYLAKMDRYTTGEAANMHRDGKGFHWTNAIRHFVNDFQSYYDNSRAHIDGGHGFLYSFLSAFYRFEQHAKLFELRDRHNQLHPAERQVPASVREILEFALSILDEKPQRTPDPIRIDHSGAYATGPVPTQDGTQPTIRQLPEMPSSMRDTPLSCSGRGAGGEGSLDATNFQTMPSPAVVWSGPLTDPSGYGEESRQFLLALDTSGIPVAGHDLHWSDGHAAIGASESTRLQALMQRSAAPGFTHVIQNFPTGFHRHPEAGISIGRTMFETDRLPSAWVKGCNRMDYIWVPSEFNRQSFAAAGVQPEKLVVIPGCLDAELYQVPEAPEGVVDEIAADPRYKFLTVFDWTLHKGWDILLRGFLEAFEGRDDVCLVLKVWSTMGYDAAAIRAQAADFARRELGHDLLADPRIRFVQEHLDAANLRALYQSTDCFVLPSRGEGWGRPYMEAMACGKPVIGTNWSGNTAFMTPEYSYLLDCDIVDVPEIGYREIPTYKGHRWAEPDGKHLVTLLRQVSNDKETAATVGAQARQDILTKFDRKVVGNQIAAELDRIRNPRLSEPRPSGSGFLPDREVAVNSPPNSSLLLPPPSMLALPPSTSKPNKPINIRWEGNQFEWASLAHVNREFCLGLLNNDDVRLSVVPRGPAHFASEEDPRFPALAERCFASLDGPADIHVRHFFPPQLNAPTEGRFVLVQPWEYGYLPVQWLEPIRQNVDEVWCYSNYVRDVYLASGIPADKLHVVPLGVDTTVFHPGALPYIFTTEPGTERQQKNSSYATPLVSVATNSYTNSPLADFVAGGLPAATSVAGSRRDTAPFTFLFLGGTIHRKGIDILLEAYQKAFTALDEVRLVIKDTGTQTVYRDAHSRERILNLISDPMRPAIVYVEDDLSAHQLAGIYTAGDCLVMPYRGEGFLLPALEAMACGIPAIVPEGGPTDDFVDETVGWRIKAEHKPFGSPTVGEWEFCGPAWQFEVNPNDLARLMRKVFNQREEVRARGAAAAERVREAWTWEHAHATALNRLDVLAKQATSQAFSQSASRTFRPEVFLPRLQSLEASGCGVFQSLPIMNEPRPTPTISLCMIVKNEERVLGDCLASIAPWVDEIIVVDTGSNDRTVAIAEEHGARQHFFPWCDDFSAARNESIRHATSEWILWMDADDTIPEECARQLHDLARLAEDGVSGFLMQVRIPPKPGEHGLTVVDHVKLFRNVPELRFEGRIHEQILEPIYRSGGKVERTDLHVVHSGYDYSDEGQARKRERDLTILEKDLQDRPDHPFVLFNIGMTAHHLADFDRAIPALERCLDLSKPRESTVRKVYAMLAGCHLGKGQLVESKATIEKGLHLFPHDPELLFRAGIVNREIGDLAGAEASYLKLLTNREVGHIDSLDVTMTGFKAHHNLAMVYMDMGRPADAERQWRAATERNPKFVPSWLALADIYMRTGRADEAGIVMEKVQALA